MEMHEKILFLLLLIITISLLTACENKPEIFGQAVSKYKENEQHYIQVYDYKAHKTHLIAVDRKVYEHVVIDNVYTFECVRSTVYNRETLEAITLKKVK